MKQVISLLILLIGCSISYIVGKTQSIEQHKKDYEAACILSDCCRNMVDHLGVDAEDIYQEYIGNLDCYNLSVTKEDMTNYYWCY